MVNYQQEASGLTEDKDPRVAAIAKVLLEALGPSPVEAPFGYDAITLAEACVRAADKALRV